MSTATPDSGVITLDGDDDKANKDSKGNADSKDNMVVDLSAAGSGESVKKTAAAVAAASGRSSRGTFGFCSFTAYD